MTDQAINPADDHLDIQMSTRRIKAIFIGSIGNLVEWYDFYAYTAFALYFAPAFFPNSDPVVQQLNAAVLFAATFLMRPLGGWLFGYHRRPLRKAAVADAVGRLHVLRLADHRGDADLRLDRLCRAGHPGAGAHHRGTEPGRRIRRQRHLSQRGRRSQASRLLFQLPIRHPDRRPAHRDHRAVAAAEGVSDAGRTEGLGLANSVRDRRAARDLCRRDAAQSAGDRGVRGSQEADEADRLDPRPA